MSETLFKYVHPARIDVLGNLKIRFSRAADFNDPFELVPRMEVPANDVLEKEVKEMRMKHFALLPASMNITWKEYEKVAQPPVAEALQQWKSYHERLIEELPPKALEMACSILGICCFSERNDSLLMWAHYAKAHEGFIIAFRRDHPFFRRWQGLHKVLYSDERPIYQPKKNYTETITTKSKAWEYECEWRLFERLDGLEPVTLNGSTFHLAELPPAVVEAVIVGARATNELTEALREVLSAPHFQHVKLLQAKLERAKFHLRFEPV